MSAKVSGIVWEHSSAKGADLIVLLAIADHARPGDGTAFPRPSTLAKEARMTDRQVRRSIRALEEMGELVILREATRQKAPLYKVMLDVLEAKPNLLKSPDNMSAEVESPDTESAVTGQDVRFIGNRQGNQEDSPNGESCATDVARVWSSYQQHHPAAKLTADRRQLITRRLKEYPAETLVAAIDGNHESAFHNGENPMGKAYHNLSLILRNADYIEGFAELHEPSDEKRSWSDEEWRAEMRRLGAPV